MIAPAPLLTHTCQHCRHWGGKPGDRLPNDCSAPVVLPECYLLDDGDRWPMRPDDGGGCRLWDPRA